MLHPQQSSDVPAPSNAVQFDASNPNLSASLPYAQPRLLAPGVDPYASSHAHQNQAQTTYYQPDGSISACSADGTSTAPGTFNPSLNNSNWVAQSLVNAAPNNMPQYIMRCEVCQINCNSNAAYEKHLAGKKHKKKLQMHNGTSSTFNSSFAGILGVIGVQNDSVVCPVCNIVCNNQEAYSKHLFGKKHALQSLQAGLNLTEMQKKGVKKTKVTQSAWCEVCKLLCNSKDIFNQHLIGKRHRRNLEKLEMPKQESVTPTPAATNPLIGPAENPVVKTGDLSKMKRVQSSEDLETKKRKVMQGGAVLTSVRVCSLCNVVCNSETVFNFHLTGQKHLAVVKQKAEVEAAAATGLQAAASA